MRIKMSRCLMLTSFGMLAISNTVTAATAQIAAPANTRMCVPGMLLFSEDFDPEKVSERWGFKEDFALRDGALLRTAVNPDEGRRVFLKDASFYNTIIQFDYRLAGQTTDLRLVTGSGGGYNSITQIHPSHFQVNTPADRDAGIVPACLGECNRQSGTGRWQTVTVEYWGDEIVSHFGEHQFVVGRHPIIDRTREYFAFQFDLPGASIDNVRVWQATGQRDSWPEDRKKLSAEQASRAAVKRDPIDHYKIENINLKSRLTLHDAAYRKLVAEHQNLQASLHEDFAEAFASHKKLSKLIAKKKAHLKANQPEFRQLEIRVHKASRAEDAYALSTKPELAGLKKSGIPRQRFTSELGQVRAQLEAAGDKQLAALVADTAQRQTDLEQRFPEAFQSVDSAVDSRQAKRKALNSDPEFQARNKLVVEAGKAIKKYEQQAAPHLDQLAAAAKAYAESQK